MDRLLPDATMEICVFCGGVAAWASTAEDAECTVPSGHTIVRAEIEGMVVETDVCPRDPAIRLS
jgi:hypothetical protein